MFFVVSGILLLLGKVVTLLVLNFKKFIEHVHKINIYLF